ncbi:glycoside hydrolase family 3 protein [Amnibacterium sp. CER49]|uniref:glycoside hydrolase family 3 protein n=1 Tax=Amnibacterium sp. CER49 TaxID=3039161 RepID=UPI00244B93F0|nr:glycoside hydrolase family 3 protein [Amnibacterium sp. CER49]MDH2444540.1 glycoside hydrolase family 3 protein [Amnibacterium sp. CER49]
MPRNSSDLRRDAATVIQPGFAGAALPDWVERRLRDGLGGVCLFAENVGTPEEVRALTDRIRAARPDAVIAIDEEGGDVTRLHARGGSPEPGNAVLGRLDDLVATEASARRIGLELVAAGVNLDYGPSADVNVDPDNPVIGTRSFGDDAELAARHVAAWIRGLQSTGVAASAKHFPGHGDTAVDSHHGLPVVGVPLSVLEARELVPFRAAIAAGVATIMTSHIVLPALDPTTPATMSRAILTDLLRERLGFEGVIVSDALDMAGASGEIGIPAAAVRSLAAGADLLCIGIRNTDEQIQGIEDAIVAAVGSGELAEERLADAARRVRGLAVPHTPSDATGVLDPGRIASTFDVSEGARRRLHQGGDWAVLRLETKPNVAVGESVWGPFAAVAADPGSDAARRFGGWPVVPVDATTEHRIESPFPRVLVIGRDNHRHPAVRWIVDDLRERGMEVVSVDMGWPSPDRRYADIATFGASRAVGQALLELLTA